MSGGDGGLGDGQAVCPGRERNQQCGIGVVAATNGHWRSFRVHDDVGVHHAPNV